MCVYVLKSTKWNVINQSAIAMLFIISGCINAKRNITYKILNEFVFYNGYTVYYQPVYMHRRVLTEALSPFF
jgi:hypothetical protein